MDGIKIGRALEKQMAEERQGQVGDALRKGEDKKEGRNILILVGILVGVLLFSVGGFKVYDNLTGMDVIDIDELHQENIEGNLDPEEGYMYNGYSFINIDDLWQTDIKKFDRWLRVRLHFGPREVEEVVTEGELDAEFNEGNEVYMAIDPEFGNKYYTLALSEINLNVVQGIKRKPVAVCNKENETVCGAEREVLSCEDSKGKPVIELRWGGEPKITLDGTCILISGEEYGIVKAANRLIWQWYGLMD